MDTYFEELNENNIYHIFFKLFFLIIIINIFNKQNNKGENKVFCFNNSFIPIYENHSSNQTNIFFFIRNLNYSFSIKYNIIKIIYEFNIYNKNQTLIKPFDLVFHNNLHILCHLKIIDSGITIDSMANIKENKYFYCIEFSKMQSLIKYGIKIYEFKDYIDYNNIYIFNNEIFNFKYLEYKNDNLFNFLIINKLFIKSFENLKKKKFTKLKKTFILPPYCGLKINFAINEEQWYFANIYNYYFCFCKGHFCLEKKIYQRCKYKFYLTIIDNNRYLYDKTDYLLADFILKNIEPIDGYPIFKEMIYQNLSSYYMTGDEKICNDNYLNKYISPFNPIIYETTINGDFLEKYLEIILKLKVVIVVNEFFSIDNIFYNIEYITYIFLGHGVSYFKQYLYKDYLSPTKYDKIIIPPSEIIISIAKKYGWEDKNIIKICLPRWDNYKMQENNFSSTNLDLNKNYSIFLMFTWRIIKAGKKISKLYLNNTFNLLNNIKLKNILKKKNITLFYTFHHSFKEKKKLIINSKNIKLIKESDISKCIKESSLIITDFSSIVFENFYKKTPFILYIPDADDPMIENLYAKSYFDIINGLKNDSIYFENKFFDLEEAIDKIIYYINNDFKIDLKLKKIFNFFNFNTKGKNHTITLINYLKQLK